MLQLREKDRQTLKMVLSRFPEIRQAWVFGSRAAGTARRASDIDLAIEAPDMTSARWHDLLETLEEAPLIYHLDVIRLDTLQDPRIKAAIRQNRTPL